MKKKSFFLLLITLILAFYVFDKTYYKDKVEFLSPLEKETLRVRRDAYGEGRFGAKRKNGRVHKGVDIVARPGSPVRAAKGGWAITRYNKDGYGNYVRIYHGAGLMTLYGHLESANMMWVKKVRQGDVIGWVGKSGNARYSGIEPHLHFEVRIDGVPADPLKGYLK